MKLNLFLFIFLFAYKSTSCQSFDSLKYQKCNIVLSKAESKYNVTFNYSSEKIESIKCVDILPESFDDFKEMISQTSGIKFKKFKDNLWIINQNFSYKIKILNTKNQPIKNAYIEEFPYERSNEFGYIFLDIKKAFTQLIISHPDYKDYTLLEISKDSPKEIIIKLENKAIQLPAINLETLYVNSITLNQNNHINAKLKKSPILAGQTQQDAFISLLNLPQIFTPIESVAELNIKGGINDQNLVLWNGIKMFQNSHFFGLLSVFNENLIDNITVIDNATPVEYGNSLSSTIRLDYDNSITKKNVYGIGMNALSSQAFTRLKMNERTELSLAFQRSFTDLFDSPTFQSYKEKAFRDTDVELFENPQIQSTIERQDEFYFQDAQFQLKKYFDEKIKVKLQGLWFENILNYEEVINNDNKRISRYNNKNVGIGIDANYRWNRTNEIIFTSNYSSHNSTGNNNTFSGNLDTNQSNEISNYFTQLYWQKQYNKTQIKAGIDFNGNIVKNKFNNRVTDAFRNLGQVSNVFSYFGSYSIKNNKWNLDAGLKGIYYFRDEEISIEPRVSISYRVNKNFKAVLRGEYKSQNFKQIIDLDQNFLGIEKRRWIVSGDSISPSLQKMNQIEMLLNFKFNKIGGYASVYRRELTGVSTNGQRFQNQDQFLTTQEGNSNIFGTLLHLYYKNTWFNAWFSYSHIKESLFFNDEKFKGNNDLEHQLTLGNNLKFNNWSFSISANYHNGLAYTNINTESPLIQSTGRNIINYLDLNSSRLPEYFRLDSSIQYQLRTKNLGNIKFSLGLINITNKKNIIRRNFRLNRVDNTRIQNIENIGLGFTANLGVLWIL